MDNQNGGPLPIQEESLNYFKIGNELLNARRFAQAEEVFRKAVTIEPNDLNFQSQLALALIEQGKFRESDRLLDQILQKDPNHAAGLWYRSISRFKEEQYQEAIFSLEQVLPLLTRDQGQFQAAHWLIATSYRRRLGLDGITYREVDKMIQHFGVYLEVAPFAEDRTEVQEFLQWVERSRPPINVERWTVVPTMEELQKRILDQQR